MPETVGFAADPERELAELRTELADLAAAASHDLIEPIALITGYTRMLRGTIEGADADVGRLLDTIEASANRLQLMLESVRDYIRLGSDVSLSEVDLSQLLEAEVERIANRCTEAGVSVEVASLPTIHGDRRLLSRLFAELLANSLAHGGEGLTKISIRGIEREDELEIEVRDDGAGLDFADADRALALTTTVHTERERGAGSGLAICRKIAVLHGGGIRVHADGGTRVVVSLGRA